LGKGGNHRLELQLSVFNH